MDKGKRAGQCTGTASQTVTFLSFSPGLFIMSLIIKNARVVTDRSTNPLQRLIEERLLEQGWSYGEVARRGALPRSTVYNLARTRNLTRPPRPATIDGLAKGLGVPASAVRAAAAESTGLHYYDEAPPDQAHGDDPAQFLLRTVMLLTSPTARRYWEDDLGLDPAAAAETADWAIRTLTSAQRDRDLPLALTPGSMFRLGRTGGVSQPWQCA
jgi:transcriptional regulator with XRE-family HTH domain